MVNIQLLVRGNEIRTVEVDNDQLVPQLKLAVANKFNIQNASEINLYLNGQPMQNEHLLSSYNLLNQTAIDLDIGLGGGRGTHGSLARAGKVKNQTPELRKQEDKKKPKTGRAKKRSQYNRRFVSVAIGPDGRRRGPNGGITS